MNSKKTLAGFAVALFVMVLPLQSAQATAPVSVRSGGYSVNAEAAILIEADSGRVLFAQNAQKKLAMASTTKIMTALITLEQPNRDSFFVVDTDAIHVEGTTMGLVDGDQTTLNQLAAGMLLPSGNDAARAAAVQVAGSQEAFVRLMNERAEQIGMTNTNFITVSGLDESGHYSTANDMAILAAEAMHNEDFRDIVSQKSMRLTFGNPPYARSLYSTNKLLESYPYAIGVKTGYTEDAGVCLVSAAKRDGVTLIAVTLDAHDDANTHRNLYEQYFTALESTDLTELVGMVKMNVAGGFEASVGAVLTETPMAALREGEIKNLRREIIAPKFVYAPVKKGDILGTVKIFSGDILLYEGDLIAEKDVVWLYPPKKEWSFLSRIFK